MRWRGPQQFLPAQELERRVCWPDPSARSTECSTAASSSVLPLLLLLLLLKKLSATMMLL